MLMLTEGMARALHKACSQGLLDVAQRLHSEGASATGYPPGYLTRYTPLHLACMEGHLSIAQWLLSVGACVNLHATDIQGKTPLHNACFRGHLDVAQ